MKIAAVIPIRFRDCCEPDGSPKRLLNGKPLWAITIEQALAARSLDKVIVALDDEAFLPHLEPWAGKIETVRRPEALSRKGVTTLDVLGFVAEKSADGGTGLDYFMLLEITHPLRPKGIIDQMVAAARQQKADSLITCHPVHYTFWRRNEQGRMGRIAGEGDRAEVALFQELTGIGSVFSSHALTGGDPFGGHVDVIPIERFWATIDVRDDDGLWLAEQYLKRTGATV
jgi:CMP-N-acetylneuraminic acid synthetase